MPDYQPLFSGGARVFDQDGKPVFARVRSGTITFALNGSFDVIGRFGIAAGVVNGSLNVVATRTSYGTFSLNVAPDDKGVFLHAATFLGGDYDYWGHLLLESLAFSYNSSLERFVLTAAWTGSVNESATSYFSAYNLAGGTRSYTKPTSLLFPEGTYSPPVTSYYSADRGTVSWDANVALSFNEA